MGLLQKINGIVDNLLRLGIGGPQLKNNSGVIEMRNATDTGFAVMRTAIPVGLDDAVPKAYADLVAHVPGLDSPQYPGMFTSHISTLRGPGLPAGGGYTVLDIDGAGYLSKIFCTLALPGYGGATPTMKFQVFIDGELTPSIDGYVEDMGCFRAASCYSDRAGGGIASGNGLSFYFEFVAPFNSHVKVQFVDLINNGNNLLGGYLEYKLGTGMNWGKYGKLWSSTMDYVVAPYATQNLLNVTSTTGGVFVGGYYDLTGQTDFHYLEGWINAVCDGYGDGYSDGYNWINVGGAQVPTSQYKFDSIEDYAQNGFYFTSGTTGKTRDVGVTYTPSSGRVAWYKWHYANPMVFDSTFVFELRNGWDGSYPTTQNTTVRGILWYYTGAVGSVASPTTIKGDQGVPGVVTQGAQGPQGPQGVFVGPYSGRIVTATRNSTTSCYSQDGRFNWVTGGTLPSGGWYGMVWDAAHSRYIVISNGATLSGSTYYSIDGGARWTAGGVTNASYQPWFKMVYDGYHQTTIAVVQSQASGAYKTSDGGVTWTQSASTIVATGWFDCCFDPGHNRCMWVSGSTTDAMYTDDGGVTFQPMASTIVAMNAIAYDPVHACVVVLPSVGQTQTQYTTDGYTWINGGVITSSNWNGLVWDPIHQKLIAVADSNSQTMFSIDGGINWANGGTIGGGAVVVRKAIYDPYTGRVMVADTGSFTVYITEDGGLTWFPITTSQPTGPILAVAYP